MRIIITRGERSDRIDAHRRDGSNVSASFPHKGPIPHDAVHFFVESELGIADGFWGLVASGRHPEEIAVIADNMFLPASVEQFLGRHCEEASAPRRADS